MFATRRALVATTASMRLPNHLARAGQQTTKALTSVADQSYDLDGFGGENASEKDNDPLNGRAASNRDKPVDDSCVRQVCGEIGGGCLNSEDVKSITEDDTNEYCWGVHPHGQESKAAGSAPDHNGSSSAESSTSHASGGVAKGMNDGLSP